MVKDAVKVDRHADAPYPAGLKSAHIVHEEAPAGMVEAAAVHEIPHDPGAEEVAAGVAATDAHLAAEAQAADAATDPTDAIGAPDDKQEG